MSLKLNLMYCAGGFKDKKELKFAVVMDDKIIKVTAPIAMLADVAGLSTLILKYMQGATEQ